VRTPVLLLAHTHRQPPPRPSDPNPDPSPSPSPSPSPNPNQVSSEAGRFYSEARSAGTVDIGELLLAIVRPTCRVGVRVGVSPATSEP